MSTILIDNASPAPALGRRLRILGVGNARSVIFLRWAWRLAERGHDVHVLSDRFSTTPGDLDGLTTYDIRELDRLTRVRGVRRLAFGRAIGRLADELEVDVVHGHYLLPYGYWAALARVRPTVISPWGTDILIDAHASTQGRTRATRALNAADALVVNSQANARAAVALGFDPARIRTIVWYADLARFGPEHRDTTTWARFGWPSDSLVVLSLRNFRPDTNIDAVVRAFRGVAASEPKARLLLAAGGGPLRAQIERLVDDLGLRSVVAFHSASEAELPTLVASADVLVAMTKSDSTPSSLLEAMASGLPAVCADAASIDEWLGAGDGGEVVPQLDEVALAASLARLLADPARRARYGERNREFVRTRVPEAGPLLEELYRQVIGEEKLAGATPGGATRIGLRRPVPTAGRATS